MTTNSKKENSLTLSSISAGNKFYWNDILCLKTRDLDGSGDCVCIELETYGLLAIKGSDEVFLASI